MSKDPLYQHIYDLRSSPPSPTSRHYIFDPGILHLDMICNPSPLTSTNMIRDPDPHTSTIYDTTCNDIIQSSHSILLTSPASPITEPTIQPNDASKHHIHELTTPVTERRWNELIFTLASCCVVNCINRRHSCTRRRRNEG